MKFWLIWNLKTSCKLYSERRSQNLNPSSLTPSIVACFLPSRTLGQAILPFSLLLPEKWKRKIGQIIWTNPSCSIILDPEYLQFEYFWGKKYHFLFAFSVGTALNYKIPKFISLLIVSLVTCEGANCLWFVVCPFLITRDESQGSWIAKPFSYGGWKPWLWCRMLDVQQWWAVTTTM